MKKGDKIHREHSSTELETEKKSRIRRKASEVERHYRCPQASCQKSYGFNHYFISLNYISSEGSLFQHVKLKHPELTEDADWKMKLHKPENEEGQT